MSAYYNIAGINIKIIGELLSVDDPAPFLPFVCDPVENPDCVITVGSEPAEIGIKPVYKYSRRQAHWAKLDDGRTFAGFFRHEDTVCANALISQDWKNIEICVNLGNARSGYLWRPVLSALFFHVCQFHKSMGLHAAAIEWNGGAIAVAAPSGTGKTTHCDLWVNNFGAEYINGDTPLLRFIDDKLYAFGVPWSGTAGIYKNIRVPLTALVFIERHPENIIEKLDPVQALKKIMPLCLCPRYDRSMMELAFDNIEAVITRADCYLLKCTPDLEAAELVRKCITASKK